MCQKASLSSKSRTPPDVVQSAGGVFSAAVSKTTAEAARLLNAIVIVGLIRQYPSSP